MPEHDPLALNSLETQSVWANRSVYVIDNPQEVTTIKNCFESRCIKVCIDQFNQETTGTSQRRQSEGEEVK